jgi:hypothetical protein
VWIAEVDVDSGVHGELGVFSHFGPLIPGERSGERSGKMPDLSGDGISDGFGTTVVGEVEQHHEPAGPLHQHPDLGCAFSSSDDQVAFPMSGHSPVFDFGGSF